MAANIPLQQRAGRNIGIESLPVFLQAAGAPEVVAQTGVPFGPRVTLFKGVSNALRTPYLRAPSSGRVFCADTDPSGALGVFFQDDQGNEMLIAGVLMVAAGSYPLDLDSAPAPFLNDKPLNLGFGEKLVAAAAGGPSPVLVVPAFHDQKMKSSRGGGFSDGGVHVERLTLTAQGVVVGPPPGVAWGGFTGGGEVDQEPASVQAINFDALLGVQVEEYFVLADGSEKLVGTTSLTNCPNTSPALNADAAKPCSLFLGQGGVLAYPNKLRYRIIPGLSEPSLPSGRVLLHFDVVEFDLPGDQE